MVKSQARLNSPSNYDYKVVPSTRNSLRSRSSFPACGRIESNFVIQKGEEEPDRQTGDREIESVQRLTLSS